MPNARPRGLLSAVAGAAALPGEALRMALTSELVPLPGVGESC